MSEKIEKKIDVLNKAQMKAWLTKNALTYAWLAQQVGTSKDNVGQWLCKNGKIPPFFVKRVEDVVAKYDLTMEALADPEDTPPAPEVPPQKTKEEKEAFITEKIKQLVKESSTDIFVVNSKNKLFCIKLYDMRGALDNPRESLNGHHSRLLTFPVPGLEDMSDAAWDVTDGFNLYNARADENYAIIPLKYAFNPRNNETILQPISQSYKWWKDNPDGTWSFWNDVAGFIYTNKYHWTEVTGIPQEKWDQKAMLKELEKEIEEFNAYRSGEQYMVSPLEWCPQRPWDAAAEATNLSHFVGMQEGVVARKIYGRKDAWKLYDEISAAVADAYWHEYNPEVDSPDKLVAAMTVYTQSCPICGTTHSLSGYVLDSTSYFQGECRKCGTVVRTDKKNLKSVLAVQQPKKHGGKLIRDVDTQRSSVTLARKFAKLVHKNHVTDKEAADFFGVTTYSVAYWKQHTFPKCRKAKLREFEKKYESGAEPKETGKDKGVGQ